MRGSLARDLLVFALGLVLGYSFAVYGGSKLLHSVAPRVPDVSLSHPAIVLILIGVVVVTLIFTSRARR